MPGVEVAVEGLLRAGVLETLALFDKPDPLDGPYFEETIYVTPSRLPTRLRRRVESLVAAAAAALGPARRPGARRAAGRRRARGSIELAARSIGGLCGETLRLARAFASKR